MKSDTQIRTDVLAELSWEPSVRSTDVGVIARDGVVTLTGELDSYPEKLSVERAVLRVKGVRAVAIDMTIRPAQAHERTDSEIAQAAEQALVWNVLVPDGAVTPLVENGHITLTGEVGWDYQRRAAENAVQELLGIRGVTNLVKVRPSVAPVDVENSIHDALVRQAENESRQVHVSVQGNAVTLRGKVASWVEHAAVQAAAWSAPGVASVLNNVVVES
ncbi:MAG: BON domain-containing protein [Pseudomonadota bacterium]